MALYVKQFYNYLIECTAFTDKQKELIKIYYDMAEKEYKQKQQEGMAKSKKNYGRPMNKIDLEKFNSFYQAFRFNQISLSFILKLFKVSKTTFYRYIKLVKYNKDESFTFISPKARLVYEKEALLIANKWSEKLWKVALKEDYIQDCCFEMWNGLAYWECSGKTFLVWGGEICKKVLNKTMSNYMREKRKLVYTGNNEWLEDVNTKDNYLIKLEDMENNEESN